MTREYMMELNLAKNTMKQKLYDKIQIKKFEDQAFNIEREQIVAMTEKIFGIIDAEFAKNNKGKKLYNMIIEKIEEDLK